MRGLGRDGRRAARWEGRREPRSEDLHRQLRRADFSGAPMLQRRGRRDVSDGSRGRSPVAVSTLVVDIAALRERRRSAEGERRAPRHNLVQPHLVHRRCSLVRSRQRTRKAFLFTEQRRDDVDGLGKAIDRRDDGGRRERRGWPARCSHGFPSHHSLLSPTLLNKMYSRTAARSLAQASRSARSQAARRHLSTAPVSSLLRRRPFPPGSS